MQTEPLSTESTEGREVVLEGGKAWSPNGGFMAESVNIFRLVGQANMWRRAGGENMDAI